MTKTVKTTPFVTTRSIVQQAWPIIVANAAVPTLGLVDTAVLGNTGSATELGAIALGTLIFSFIYWSFGFLRMSTTGFTAQAAGAGDEAEVRASLARAVLLAIAIGTTLIAFSWFIGELAFQLLDASQRVEQVAADYFEVRIWGAPATLGTYALMGSFIGLGMSRQLLAVQLFLNTLNMGLDVWFAGSLGWGARGIAWGTAIAEWTTLVLSLLLAYRALKHRHADARPFFAWGSIVERGKLTRMLTSNGDIMLRSLMLLFGFGWFTNQGAQFGDAVLAANHVLLSFLMFSAFFLDGYAFVAESLVGAAVGSRQRGQFERIVRRSSELSAATALVLALGILVFGSGAIAALTDIHDVRLQANRYLPLAALYVLVGFAAFQLDGIFIGATRTKEMRNAALLSLIVFLIVGWPLCRWFENTGLWLAFVIYVLARAVALMIYYPALKREL